MILSDVDLKKALEAGDIILQPLRERCVQPASLDLKLGDEFASWPDGRYREPTEWIDLGKPLPEQQKMHIVRASTFRLPPLGFALAVTQERVKLSPRLRAKVEGRSTLGRLGLMVHSTAGYIDPGWDGQITLELFNLSPYGMILEAGQDICQLEVALLSTAAEKPYGSAGLGSKYQGQNGVQPSRWGAVGT